MDTSGAPVEFSQVAFCYTFTVFLSLPQSHTGRQRTNRGLFEGDLVHTDHSYPGNSIPIRHVSRWWCQWGLDPPPPPIFFCIRIKKRNDIVIYIKIKHFVIKYMLFKNIILQYENRPLQERSNGRKSIIICSWIEHLRWQ